MSDFADYRPFTLSNAQAHEILNSRIKRLTETIKFKKKLDSSSFYEEKELGIASWLKEALPAGDIRFTLSEFVEFIGNSRQP